MRHSQGERLESRVDGEGLNLVSSSRERIAVQRARLDGERSRAWQSVLEQRLLQRSSGGVRILPDYFVGGGRCDSLLICGGRDPRPISKASIRSHSARRL
jgi:hypothetical protein